MTMEGKGKNADIPIWKGEVGKYYTTYWEIIFFYNVTCKLYFENFVLVGCVII